ncbi:MULTISPECIES: hypothetical protein [unclassified Streptomyces]|uniref:hypothetical protein n=1 Tax=unclassified Streptomyces TaxID=2593676 RepID=UPI003BB5CD24
MIVHDLATLGTTLIGRAVLTVSATAGIATALLLGGLALAAHLRGRARTARAVEYEEAA